jgi:polar amino acid transport system permease protein
MEYIDFLSRFYPLLLKGMLMTVQVLLASASVSFVFGLGFGILLCKRLRIPILSHLVGGVAFVYRAVPFFVQLLIVYFVLPELLGVNFDPFAASVIALGMCSSGYVAQIVCAGINSIPTSQWEAAFTLGYTRFQSLRYIILPQMARNVLPVFNNELDALLKSTAIVSSIGLLELTRVGMNIVSRELDPIRVYLTIASIYLLLSALLNLITRNFERKIAYVKY